MPHQAHLVLGGGHDTPHSIPQVHHVGGVHGVTAARTQAAWRHVRAGDAAHGQRLDGQREPARASSAARGVGAGGGMGSLLRVLVGTQGHGREGQAGGGQGGGCREGTHMRSMVRKARPALAPTAATLGRSGEVATMYALGTAFLPVWVVGEGAGRENEGAVQ